MKRTTTSTKSLQKNLLRQRSKSKVKKKTEQQKSKLNKPISSDANNSEMEIVQNNGVPSTADEKVSILEHLIPEDRQDTNMEFSSTKYWKDLARRTGHLFRVFIIILIALLLLTAIAKAAEILLGVKLIPILSIWIGHDFVSFFAYSIRILFYR